MIIKGNKVSLNSDAIRMVKLDDDTDIIIIFHNGDVRYVSKNVESKGEMLVDEKLYDATMEYYF